jgi:hypothetical protein
MFLKPLIVSRVSLSSKKARPVHSPADIQIAALPQKSKTAQIQSSRDVTTSSGVRIVKDEFDLVEFKRGADRLRTPVLPTCQCFMQQFAQLNSGFVRLRF